jgi:hypothetical protein
MILYYTYLRVSQRFSFSCHLRIKSAHFLMDLKFKSAHLILGLLSYP